MSKSISKRIGNIKREYEKNDFNPFKAMEFIYDQCLAGGAGRTVTIVGYTPRFKESIAVAWLHVLHSRKMIKGDLPAPDRDGYAITHTGTTIRFLGLEDVNNSQVKLNEVIDQSDCIVFCSPYKNPAIRSAMKHNCDHVDMYDVSKNNLE